MFYSIAKGIVSFVVVFVFRLKRRGVENVPKEGGVILAFNHRSYWDPVVAAITSKRHLHFMAKAELFKNPIFGGLIKSLGAFPVSRGRNDIGAIKAAMKILRDGETMLIFPEGSRIKNGRKVKAKAGVACIAQMARVPVIPVNISGEYKWMRKITVTYGEPIYLDEYYGKKMDQAAAASEAENILENIRALDNDLSGEEKEN